jgi:hypothetical protein
MEGGKVAGLVLFSTCDGGVVLVHSESGTIRCRSPGMSRT